MTRLVSFTVSIRLNTGQYSDVCFYNNSCSWVQSWVKVVGV
jgi:hypothetical protein